MIISIDAKKSAFFHDVFSDLLASVVKEGSSRSIFRSFAGFDGYGFVGLGHEGSALLILSCLHGLPKNVEGEVLETLVLHACLQCKINSQTETVNFLSVFAALVMEYAAEPTKSYRCLFFLPVENLPDWLINSSILGHRLKIASSTSLRVNKTNLGRVLDTTEITEIDLANMQAVEVGIAARTPVEAVGIADRVCGVLRGAYYAAGSSNWSLAGKTRSSNRFGPSPGYLVREGRRPVEWAYVASATPQITRLPDKCPARTCLLLDRLARPVRQGSSRQVLADALVLFSSAADEKRAHNEFLGLWQTVECLSLVAGGDTTKVAANIGNLWRNGNETIRYQLLALAPIRNLLVHTGTYESDRQSANFLLTRIVREALIQFAQLSDKLSAKGQFLKLMSMMTLPPKLLTGKDLATKTVKHVRGLS